MCIFLDASAFMCRYSFIPLVISADKEAWKEKVDTIQCTEYSKKAGTLAGHMLVTLNKIWQKKDKGDMENPFVK